ncbi:MAG: hypothetical protein WA231_10575, partial [Methylocella sp.]
EQGQESDVVRHPQGVGKGPTGAIAMTPGGLGVDIGPGLASGTIFASSPPISAAWLRGEERSNRRIRPHCRNRFSAWRSWIPSYGRWYTTA